MSYLYSHTNNKFVSVGEVRYAYRSVGEGGEVPLVLLMHTRGNMDSWDPELIEGLAQRRIVVTFDNKGTGLTNGKAPLTFAEMADDAADFIQALGYKKVDILGFSIGGAVGQELLIRHANLVRRAILAGTSAQGGEGVNQIDERSKSVSTKSELTAEDLLYGFFAPTANSQARGKDFVARLKLRKSDLDVPVSMDTTKAQAIARAEWGKPHAGVDDILHGVKAPVLIANGKEDIRMPTINSYNLFKTLPNAQLILYPDSGHGFLFQYPKLCAADFNVFLDQNEVQ